MKKALGISSLACGWAMLLAASVANATTVQFQTVMGDFEVNLYDETTPETVANFLAYIENNAYNDSFFHRSIPDFILQGGGFAYHIEDQEVDVIPKRNAVNNEPVYSNRRGTIAMAKVPGNVNSATNQWFINLKDNQANLDIQNGGFTVFGEVMGEGMEVIDAIAKLPRYKLDDFTDLPLRNYTEDDIDNKVSVSEDHFVIVTSIQVLDAAPDTAADLDPVPNTLIDQVNDDKGDSDGGGSSGGGSFGWLTLMLLGGLGIGLRKIA